MRLRDKWKKRSWALLIFSSILCLSFRNQIKKLTFTSKLDKSVCVMQTDQYESEKIAIFSHAQAAHLKEELQAQSSDFEKVLYLTNWVHTKAKNHGTESSEAQTASDILSDISGDLKINSKQYTRLIGSMLKSLKIHSRVITMYPKWFELSNRPKPHHIIEVYMPFYQKWVMIDPQFNLCPMQNNVPLTALELQTALAEQEKDIQLKRLDEYHVDKRYIKDYFTYILPYIHYLQTNKWYVNKNEVKAKTCKDISELILHPQHSKIPDHHAGKHRVYTHSAASFYAPPLLKDEE